MQVNRLLFTVVSHLHVTSASVVAKLEAHAKTTSSLLVNVPVTVIALSKEGRVLGSHVSVITSACYSSARTLFDISPFICAAIISSWSRGNAFVAGAGGLRFKSRDGQVDTALLYVFNEILEETFTTFTFSKKFCKKNGFVDSFLILSFLICL